MNSIKPEELVLEGSWITVSGNVVEDENCKRIWYVTSQILEKIGDSKDGWRQLFIDPKDNRLWELDFPHSDQHGGGPPRLSVVKKSDIEDNYNL